MIAKSRTRFRASVVVPVRNRPDLLREALRPLVAQDLENDDYEIIVSDDGSDEDISSVLAAFASEPECKAHMRLLSLTPRGPAAARNAGIRIAQGDIVVFVDSDVVTDVSMVRLLTEALEREPSWVGAEACLLPSEGSEGLLWDAPQSKQGNHYHTAAIAYRRSLLMAIGGFDETFELPACEDVELAMCALRYGRIGFVPAAIAYHPRRRITAWTHWKWRKHWRYETVLAVRHGVLSFPSRPSGRYPRLRVLWAAVASLPAGRFLAAMRGFTHSRRDAALAAVYAIFDVACGIVAAPSILFWRVPRRLNYLLP